MLAFYICDLNVNKTALNIGEGGRGVEQINSKQSQTIN